MASVSTLRAGSRCVERMILGSSTNHVQQSVRGYRDTVDHKVVVVTGASRYLLNEFNYSLAFMNVNSEGLVMP